MLGLSVEPQGEEWFTITDFMKRYGHSDSTACRILANLEKSGKLESWTGRVSSTKRHGKKYRLK